MINTIDLPDLDMCFDWIQCTVHDWDIETVLFEVFQTTIDKCQYTESGRNGYNRTYTVGTKMHVMYHITNEKMGIHLMFSGSACREYEDLFPWEYFFLSCKNLNARFTRIDIAIDTYKKYFTVKQLKTKIKNTEVISKFKKGTYMTQYNIKDGSSNSASLTFGSMSSDVFVCIYDKLAERENAGYKINENIKFWTRTELRFRHDLSQKIYELYFDNDFKLSNYVMKVLYNYIDFKDPTSDKNKSRWETSKFRKTFLGDVDKLEIREKAYQTSIQKKKNYAEVRLSKLLSMICVCDNDFFNTLMTNGLSKIKEMDLNIINSHLIANNMKVLTMSDIKAHINNLGRPIDDKDIIEKEWWEK